MEPVDTIKLAMEVGGVAVTAGGVVWSAVNNLKKKWERLEKRVDLSLKCIKNGTTTQSECKSACQSLMGRHDVMLDDLRGDIQRVKDKFRKLVEEARSAGLELAHVNTNTDTLDIKQITQTLSKHLLRDLTAEFGKTNAGLGEKSHVFYDSNVEALNKALADRD